MFQYLLFFALVPIALAGIVLALTLPKLVRSYQRFSWLTIFNLIQLGLIVNIVETLVLDPEVKRILASVDHVFVGSWAIAWFFFSLEYTGIFRAKRPWQAILFALPAASCACGILDPELVWRGLDFERVGRILVMHTEGYGPVALALFVQSYALMLAGSFILLKNVALNHALFRKQTALLVVGVIVPTFFNLLYILKIFPLWTKDFSMPMAALGGFCFSLGCLRYKLFSVVPVSPQKLFEHMKVGFIVADAEGRIVDLNIAACRILGKSEIVLLGQDVEPELSSVMSRVRVLRHRIHSEGEAEVAGWQIELRELEAESESPGGLPDASSSEESFAIEERQFLSLGEMRVVELLAQNLSNKEIADRLGLSVNTVKFHLSNAYAKTGSHGRAELVARVAEITNARR